MNKTFKVLSIDGGGMRGLYSASYVNGLIELASKRYNSDISDFGKQFDLIAGTSTGAILGCALAKGISLREIISLYTNVGNKIFPRQLPKSKWKILLHNRKKYNQQGEEALRSALQNTFGDQTLSSIFEERKIGLVVPTVNFTTHKAWVFKTPHDQKSSHRDDDYTLVDTCLASSAAPIYRSLASVKKPGYSSTYDLFVDGGLWANNPVLVALIEALRVSKPDQTIQIFSLGTSAAPNGSVHDPKKPHWGLKEWSFGAKAIELSMDAQTKVTDDMAHMLSGVIDRDINIIRFPEPEIPKEHSNLLELDNASRESCDLLLRLAGIAVDKTNQLLNSHKNEGLLISHLLENNKLSLTTKMENNYV